MRQYTHKDYDRLFLEISIGKYLNQSSDKDKANCFTSLGNPSLPSEELADIQDNELEAIPIIEESTLEPIQDNLIPPEIAEAPGIIFKQISMDLVKEKVTKAAELYCSGKPNLYAYLMTTCYDHNLIVDRSSYTEFVRALAAWGIITDFGRIKTIANSVGKKMNKLSPRYKGWPKDKEKDKDICQGIADIFGETIRYKY